MDNFSRTPGAWRELDLDDRFMDHVGPVLILDRPDAPDEPLRIGIEIRDVHCNRINICHGGMLATLLDVALGVTGSRVVAQDRPTPTISLSMDFLRPVVSGEWVESRVRVVHASHRMAFVEGMLVTEAGVALRGNAIFKRPSAS